MASKFDVVISGVSGRFPECDDVLTFKKKLYNLENFITSDSRKWPLDYSYNLGRWVIPNGTGKYTNVKYIDFKCFKLNAVLAESQDIIGRKVLEPSFEAIVDAGINPFSLDGENVGVYMACGIAEYESKLGDKNVILKSFINGTARCMQSNRVSFAFNLTGPSVTLMDDIWGSTNILKIAYDALAAGHINAAIVGVGSSMIDPKVSLHYSNMGFLSPDSLTRVFDKRANGYARSESTVILYLQRAEDAKRSYGSIIFCDTYYMGLRTSTVLKYDEKSLQDALESIYKKYNFSDAVSKVAFMELTATGIKMKDRIESNVVTKIYEKRKIPLLVGSIKSNVGHTEGAASFMSLLKVLFALDSGLIAPNMNFEIMDDEIEALKTKKLKVVDKVTQLEGDVAVVNTVGLFGSVHHIAVKQNPKIDNEENKDKLPRLLFISGRTDDRLREAVKQIEKQPINENFVALMNDVFGTNIPQHLYRGYSVLRRNFKPISSVEKKGDHGRPIWFVFTGMGSQWNGCGLGLLDLPVFADTIKKCDAILRPRGLDIYRVITSDDPTIFDRILNAFVGITCIQLGLIEILRAIKIEPDGILGHSLGENTCAYADGGFTLEQAVISSYERGKSTETLTTINGMMAAIGRGYKDIKDILPEGVYIACHNASDNCTISGPTEEVEKFVDQLKQKGIFARSVNVGNIPFHSPYIAHLGPEYEKKLKHVIPNPKLRSSKWISTAIPEQDWNTPLAKYCSTEYFTFNLLNTVLFEEGIKWIPENAVVIEIAPHGMFQPILKRSLPQSCTNISLTMRSKTKENLSFLLSAIGRIYAAGCEPQVNNLFPKIDFPVPRNTPSLAPYCTWLSDDADPTQSVTRPNPNIPLSQEKIHIRLNYGSDFDFLNDHKIKQEIILPASLYVHLSCWIFSLIRREKFGQTPFLLEKVKINKNLKISLNKPKAMSVMIQASGSFEVLLENEDKPEKSCTLATGIIRTMDPEPEVNANKKPDSNSGISVNKDEFYNALRNIGYNLSNGFALVEGLESYGDEIYGNIKWNGHWMMFLDSAIKLQMFSRIEKNTDFMYPTFINKLVVNFKQLENIEEGSSLPCHYNMILNKFQSPGIVIEGLKFEGKKSCSFSKRKLEAFRFVPFENPNCQNPDEFIDVCLQLVTEMILVSNKPMSPKLQVICTPESSSYLKIIHEIVKRSSFLKAHIKFKSIFEETPKNKSILLISTEPNNYSNVNVENLFVLCITSRHHFMRNWDPNFSLIIKQSFEENIYLLQKKTNSQHSGTVVACSNYQKSNFNIKCNLDLNDLTSIVSPKSWRTDDRTLFMLGECSEEKKRFILSKNANYFNNLSHILVKNREIGSYKRISQEEYTLKRIRISNIQLQAISLDDPLPLNSEDINQNKHYRVDYSGRDEFGNCLMGIAHIDSSTDVGQIDEILKWRIPPNWSFEDAATIPGLYGMAYSIYMISNPQNCSKTVLINVGQETLFAGICIRLFVEKKYSVYITLPSKSNSADIFAGIPEVDKVCVLCEENCQYKEQLLQLTRKKKVELVINCLPGKEHFDASFTFGGFNSLIFAVHSNIEKNICDIGMSRFLGNNMFRLIPSRLSYISNLPIVYKKEIQKLVQHGINSGFVIPLPRKVSSMETPMEESDSGFKHVIRCSPNENGSRNSRKFDNKHSYVIIGSGSGGSWYQLLLWLRMHGCTKFFIGIENLNEETLSSNNLEDFKNEGSLLYISPSKFDSIDESCQIINEIQEISPLGAIFFVGHNSANEKIKNADLALQYKNLQIPLISIFSGGLTELESRRSKGLPACVLHCSDAEKYSQIAVIMDELISSFNFNTSPVLFNVVEDYEKSDNLCQNLKLSDFLPADLKELEDLGKNVKNEIKFTEHVSRSPPYAQTKGVYPIFVLPAVYGSTLRNLLRSLNYPLFTATFTCFENALPEVANKLFKELTKIQPTGPISLISETWNANLALQLSRLLKCNQRQYRIFLIESNPNEWNKYVQSFGAPSSPEFDDMTLREIFSPNLKDDFASEFQSFEEKVHYFLSKSVNMDLNLKHVMNAINMIKYHLNLAAQFSMQNDILENVFLLIRKLSNNHNLKLSDTSNVIFLNDLNYEQFLENPKLRTAINENVLYAW